MLTHRACSLSLLPWTVTKGPRHPGARVLALPQEEDRPRLCGLVWPSPMELGQYHADHSKLSCPQLTITRPKWLALPLKKDHSMHKQQLAASREGHEAAQGGSALPGDNSLIILFSGEYH